MATSDRSELGRVGGYETSFVVHEDALAKTWLAQSIEPLAEEQTSVELTRIAGELGRREELQRALKREVEAAAQVADPAFARPELAFVLDSALFVVCEQRAGTRLSTLVRQRAAVGNSLPLEVVVRLFLDVAGGLAAMHRAGLAHADVTLGNVQVTQEGHALLVFSGLGSAFPTGQRNERVGYKSPEQLRGQSATSRADVFACGVALFECLTGHHPFVRESESDTVARVLETDPDALLDALPAGLPGRVRHMLARALSHDPDERFRDGEALATELLACGIATASRLEVAAVLRERTSRELSAPNDEMTRIGGLGVAPGTLPAPRRLPPPKPKRTAMPAAFEPKPVEPKTMSLESAPSGLADDDAATLLYVRDPLASATLTTAPPLSDDRAEVSHAPERSFPWVASVWGAVAALVVFAVWADKSRPKESHAAAAESPSSAAPPASHAGHEEHMAAANAKPGSDAKPAADVPSAAEPAPPNCNADLTKDPLNCGACGNDCGGAKCSEGVCAPSVVASNKARPSGIATDGSHVYWTNAAASGSVMKVPLRGGKPMTLAGSLTSPDGIAVDESHVYWTSSSGSVMSAPRDGGKPSTLAQKQDQPTSITARGGSVYWTNQTGAGSVMKVKASGDSAKPIVTGVNMPCGVAVDDQSVYYTSYGSGTVSRVGLEGGKPSVLANGQAFPCNVAVQGASLFWVNTGRPASVMRADLASGTVKALVSNIAAPSGVATDGRHVYWTTTDKAGAVLRVPVDGGTPQVMARGVGNPAAIAVAQGMLVFADYSGGDVFKIALGKPAPAATAVAAPAPAPAAEPAPEAHHDHAAMAASAPPPAAVAPAPSASAAAAPASAPAPAAAAAAGGAAVTGTPDVEIKLASKGNLMAYDQTSFTVKTGQKVKVVFQNVSTSKVMSHNWVLVQPGTEAKVAEAGLAAGEASSYVVFPGENVIAATKLAGPGETVEILFIAPAPGTYPFICTMPGHYMVMKGTFTVTP